MTLPNVLDKANWQKLQFEWRGPSYEDLSSHKVGRAIGTGFMIAGYVQDPCPFGMHGFHQLPWDNFPVIVEFPDVANDPFFIGATHMEITVSFSSFFYGPRPVTVVEPCTALITNYASSMHAYLALGSANGPIATDLSGEPFEWYYSGGQWLGHERPWFLGGAMDAAFYLSPVIGTLPHYWWVLESGFFENFYPSLEITVRTTSGPLPPPPYVSPPPPPPPTDMPPMPGCAAGGTPTTVGLGEPRSGVVPIQ
jgi:hypothetical protein